MSRRTRLGRPMPAHDTLHVVPVLGPDAEPMFDLLLYGLDDSDIYLSPNPYVSEALNRRELPAGCAVSPFFVRKER